MSAPAGRAGPSSEKRARITTVAMGATLTLAIFLDVIPAISDHLQSRGYEEGPWKGPPSLCALAHSVVADYFWRILTYKIP